MSVHFPNLELTILILLYFPVWFKDISFNCNRNVFYFIDRQYSSITCIDSVSFSGILMEGLGCIMAGLWGTANGTTSYSENVGAITMTKVCHSTKPLTFMAMPTIPCNNHFHIIESI